MSLAENLSGQLAISKELILVQQSVTDKEELLSHLADLLHKQGYAKSSFKDALLSRERVFPTGLITRVTGVAIPHTDSSHVNKSAIAIATLHHPVVFQAMDDPANTVMVEIVIMLAIKESKSQLEMLQKIMQILQQYDVLIGIQKARTTSEVMGILNELLSS